MHLKVKSLSTHLDQLISISGWVNTMRKHDKVIFCDLRDETGILQIIIKKTNDKLFQIAKSLSSEDVISVSGIVKERNPNQYREGISGHIELDCHTIDILSKCETSLPFLISNNSLDNHLNENVCLKYRCHYLRTSFMQHNIRFQSDLLHMIREHLKKLNFVDIPTPLLAKSTPEGARDFLVFNSRYEPGKAYALPQSPQLFKQMLVVAGFEKYYQIATCFRDEDLRSIRQPEFRQLDLECAFAKKEDIQNLIENLIKEIFLFAGKKLEPFLVMTYQEALRQFGTDKPDLRNPLKITETFSSYLIVTELSKEYIENRINENLSWSFQYELKTYGNQTFICSITKTEHDLLSLGRIIKFLIKEKELGHLYYPLWVTDFPMFIPEIQPNGTQIITAGHHPFTKVNHKQISEFNNYTTGLSYDLVINGIEIGGGSEREIRIPFLLETFKRIGYTEEQVYRDFGFFLDNLLIGVPPHAGIAIGLERLFMQLLSLENIRDIIPFPKTQTGRCLFTQSPVEPSDEQMKLLFLKREI
jgi:aspartyl-tRNA synthetase